MTYGPIQAGLFGACQEVYPTRLEDEPGDLGPDEPTRRCVHCKALIRRRDEQRGTCPNCGRLLARLW